jgi:hypothetical protein
VIDKEFIFVIVDAAKDNMRKTEYKVSNNVVGDCWVKLKRGPNKSGIEFRIMRRVDLLSVNEDGSSVAD